MAYKTTFPFFAIKLSLATGDTISMPLNDLNAMRMNEPVERMMGKFVEAFQQKTLDKGKLLPMMHEQQDTNFAGGLLTVTFQAARDGVKHPQFQVHYPYIYRPSGKGFWGLVPALAVEAYTEELENLEENLVDAIKMDFSRNRRFAAMQRVLSAIWFEQIELWQDEMHLRFPTPLELEEKPKEQRKRLLPQLGRKLSFSHRVTYGREAELKQFLRAIKSEFNRNVLLVGNSGVGKTALVGELVRTLKTEKSKLEIWQTTAATMIKELMRDTGWQDNLGKLCKELSEQPNSVLFVRNLMELFEVGQYSGNTMSVAAFLRTSISRGEVTMISECTKEELAQIELKNPQFTSLFHVIRLEEPKEDLEDIIIQKVNAMAANRKVKLSREAAQESIRLHRRFTPYSGFPGKPIRFIESLLIGKVANGEKLKNTEVTRAEVVQYFCEETGMPPFIVDPDIPMDISEIIEDFNRNVYGQSQAVERVGNLLAGIKTALIKSGKPIASFLFVGPTGVGKTELAKVLAKFMFGHRDRMIRFDMSEYSSPYDVMRLIGLGQADGVLTAAVRREPFAVLLFDEIEKADNTFYDLLLQVLDAGRLTDNRGKVVNFCSTIIIMTSNIGAAKLQQGSLQVGKRNQEQEVMDHFLEAVKTHFRPELYNRIDEVIPFVALTKEVVRKVVNREMDLLRKREGIQYRSLRLEMEDTVLDYLAEKGYDSKYGARQLQRAIREELIIPLAYRLNLEEYDDEVEIKVTSKAGKTLDIAVKVNAMGVESYVQKWDEIVQADFASDLRRSMQQLKDGSYFLSLSNELEDLEQKKEKLKADFWKNPQEGARYANLYETDEKLEKLHTEIEAYEMQSALASMDMQKTNAPDETALKTWELSFSDIQVEIYTRLNLNADQAYLHVYGKNFEPILAFYLALFEHKNFEWKAKSIWFNDKHYNTVLQERERLGDDWDDSLKPYFYQTFLSSKKGNFKSPSPNTSLHGIEFEITGRCAHLYLKSEMGLHRWKFSQNQDFKYKVEVHDTASETPLDIHRRIFYQRQTIKRTVEPQKIKDSALDLDREYNRGQLLDLIIEKLDKNFKSTIDAEVL